MSSWLLNLMVHLYYSIACCSICREWSHRKRTYDVVNFQHRPHELSREE